MIDCDEVDWSEPRKCPKCGGEVHEHFEDENYDGDYYTIKHCHKCGESFDDDEFQKMELLKKETATKKELTFRRN